MSTPTSPAKRSLEDAQVSPLKFMKEADPFLDELKAKGITCHACVAWYTSTAQPEIGGHDLSAGCRSKDNVNVEAMDDAVDPATRGADGIVIELEEGEIPPEETKEVQVAETEELEEGEIRQDTNSVNDSQKTQLLPEDPVENSAEVEEE